MIFGTFGGASTFCKKGTDFLVIFGTFRRRKESQISAGGAKWGFGSVRLRLPYALGIGLPPWKAGSQGRSGNEARGATRNARRHKGKRPQHGRLWGEGGTHAAQVPPMPKTL